jgi:hypothetical protein
MDGWRVKLYSIVHRASDLSWEGFEPAIDRAMAALPTPAQTDARAGVGFIIAHEARSVWYLTLGWWDRENELPLRIWVRELAEGAMWRPAQGAESVCVWDLEVIGFERDAYVSTVLAPDGPQVERYIGMRVDRRPSGTVTVTQEP